MRDIACDIGCTYGDVCIYVCVYVALRLYVCLICVCVLAIAIFSRFSRLDLRLPLAAGLDVSRAVRLCPAVHAARFFAFRRFYCLRLSLLAPSCLVTCFFYVRPAGLLHAITQRGHYLPLE